MSGKKSILEILFAAAACGKTGRRFCPVVRRLYMRTIAITMETAPWSAPQPLLQPGDAFIQKGGHHAEKEDGEHNPVHLEELRQNGRENDKVGISVNIIYILNGYLKKKLQ